MKILKIFFELMKEKLPTYAAYLCYRHSLQAIAHCYFGELYCCKHSLYIDWLLHKVIFILAALGQRFTTTSMLRTVSLVFFLIEKVSSYLDSALFFSTWLFEQ
jgi:hypothetical protein